MNRRLAIVAIIVMLAAVGSRTLIFNPGQYGMMLDLERIRQGGRP